jgi:uncharacterized repeat protein (TIGR03803 family)
VCPFHWPISIEDDEEEKPMHTKQQFCNSLSRTISCAAMALIIMFAVAAVPGLAQNAVPPTARQAAASPAFASRLAHQVPAHPATKSRAVGRSRRASPQDQILYDNGPYNGTTDAWTINFGFTASDSFTVPSGSNIDALHFVYWNASTSDLLTTVDMQIGSTSFGGSTQTLTGVTNTFLGTNQYGYALYQADYSFSNVPWSGAGYVTLSNACTTSGCSVSNPIYWDENSGPSSAYENTLGSIPSEAFTVEGSSGGPPYPCGYGWSKPTEPSRTQAGKAQSFQVIYNFTGGDDGAGPNGLTRDHAGNLYGTAASGGYNNGTVFELAHRGSGWVLKPLYQFTGEGGDGAGPSSKVLFGADGSLYGATGGGGTGYGTVYNLKPPPTACRVIPCNWMETVLYRFKGSPGDDSDNTKGRACGSQSLNLPALKLPLDGSDGAWPWGDLASDQAGNIYGLATGGPQDEGCSCRPCGIIYNLSPSADGWVESISTRFDMYTGGVTSGLASNSTSGITTFIKWDMGGGDWDFGGWADGYKLPRDGSMGVFPISVLFNGGDVFFTTFDNGGDCPGGLFNNGERLYTGHTGDLKVADAAGNLYGIDGNSIFKMSPGDGGWTYTVLYQFTGGVDGSGPTDLILDARDASGNLWGTAAGGGAYGKGVIFEITP